MKRINGFISAVFHFQEANECENAKDMFEGRLNPDMVAEKLGHTDYADVNYLTLESCSIR